MVYLLFSQGSRPGGSNSTRAADTGVIPLTFEADFMDNYELGIKSTWLDNRLQVNAQLFMMKWSDFQVYDNPEGSPWWLAGTLNGETAQTDGLEINVKWQATDNLTINAALTLQDARFTETATVGGSDYYDGMDMPNSPDEKAYLGINYNLPELWGHDAWLWYDISYEGSTWNTTSNVRSNYLDGETEGFAPSKNISNFQAGIAFDNDLDLTLRVDNVWDQEVYYIVNTSDNFESGYFGSPRGLDQRTLVRPRTIWLNFRKGFGQ
jgi:outer membrane receptor protein involved in Fe transport